jgi:hypothetical protein
MVMVDLQVLNSQVPSSSPPVGQCKSDAAAANLSFEFQRMLSVDKFMKGFTTTDMLFS